MIMSSVAAVRDLSDRMVRKTPRMAASEATALVVVDHVTVVRLLSNHWWCSHDGLRKFAYPPGAPVIGKVVKGLRQLGLLSRADYQAFLVEHKAARKDIDLRSDQSHVNYLARKYGFTAPKLAKEGA